MNNFYIGQKVVWVGNPNGKKSPPEYRLTKGKIYTIRDIDLRAVDLHGCATIRVEEMIRPVVFAIDVDLIWEIGYHPNSFRPLVKKKTDISIFTAMLNKNKELV